MKTIIKKTTALYTLLGGLYLSPVAIAQNANNTFSKDETKAIEKIVRDYLLNNPTILIEVSEKLKQQMADNKSNQIMAVQDTLFNNPNFPVMGNPNGTVVLAEFADYQCGYCKRMYPVVKDALKKHKDLKVIMVEFPILGEVSLYASRVALAAAKQGKYSPIHDALMKHKGRLSKEKIDAIAEDLKLDMDKLKSDINDTNIKNTIQTSLSLARTLGITGTPTLIGQNVPKISSGLLSTSQLDDLIGKIRKNSQQ